MVSLEDCIFYSNHWTLLREGKGSSSGSDHKPVYVPRLSAVFPEHYQLLLVNKPLFFGGSHGSPWGLWVEYG
jgi:long-subunit fatty acid transport protein